MRRRTVVTLAALVASGAVIVACTLNPQPLPPGEATSVGDFDASASHDGRAAVAPEGPTPDVDAAGGKLEAGAFDAATDAGDAGDAGDAAPDANDDPVID